jgi:glycosyltransferase involved in cell wall biosynthesis
VKQNTFSIVVSTYNRAEKLQKMIEAFMSQNYPKDKFELIVSDDGSTDATGKMVKRYPVVYIKNPHQGIVKCLNRGMKLAKNEFMINIPDDNLPEPNFLKDCNEWINKYPKYSAFAAIQLPTDEESKSNVFARYESSMVDYYLSQGGFGNPQIISKEALKDINYLDGAEGYSEDAELWERLKKKDYKVMQTSVRVAHMRDYSLDGFIQQAKNRAKMGRAYRGRAFLVGKLIATPVLSLVYLYRMRKVDMALMLTAFNFMSSAYGAFG